MGGLGAPLLRRDRYPRLNHPGAFTALQRRPVQGAEAAASFEAALRAFSKAGFGLAEACGAVKVTSRLALTVGLERGRAVQGLIPETEVEVEALPPEAFPHVRRLGGVTDPETAWNFSLDTSVSGLRAQLRRARPR